LGEKAKEEIAVAAREIPEDSEALAAPVSVAERQRP